ncbi:MAG: FAD synthetase family protein [Treponema sp.]|nr:FAD synthetase family protein [Treponema sp.]
MQVLEWDKFIKDGLPEAGTAVTVGVFDGVHKGHKALIDRIVNFDRQVVPLVVTFEQTHKKAIEILSFRQKLALFESLGVGIVIIARMSDSFKRLSGEEFINILRNRAGMKYMALGKNFCCGYRRDTDAQKIEELNLAHGIKTDILDEITEGGAPISSSRVRAAIMAGDIDEAEALLGRPFVLDPDGEA